LIEPQSPAFGPLAVPSPFVSPPAESSASDVKTTGCCAVPRIFSVPFKSSRPGSVPKVPAPSLSFTVVPGWTVSVTPVATVTGPLTTTTPDQVVFALIVPETVGPV
jgi:hypothetical protein